ncbi:hypothetical protein [Brevifollis gellanilyticus]|uniref:hypothetical protein n=1 Tax=Brevifollis gellanilyticus TaxID=748831 RepID=UPI0011BDDCD7|nr:hypothetical protein [Brevifollis gellanilyticus]
MMSDVALDTRGLIESLGWTVPSEGLGHYLLSAVDVVYFVTGFYCYILSGGVFVIYLLCRYVGGLPFTIMTSRWAGVAGIVLGWSLFMSPVSFWQSDLSRALPHPMVLSSTVALIFTLIRPGYTLAVHSALNGYYVINFALGSIHHGIASIGYGALGFLAMAIPLIGFIWEKQSRKVSSVTTFTPIPP